MDDKPPVFLDTNIILRWNIAEAPQHASVREAVTLLISAGHPLWVSLQVMREFAAVMTRPQTFGSPLPESAVAERIRALVARLNVAEETFAVHRELLGFMESYPMGGKQIHDANIVATMLAFGIPILLTLNLSDFARFSNRITLVSLEDVPALVRRSPDDPSRS